MPLQADDTQQHILTGIVVDAISQRPLPFATVRLYRQNKLTHGTITDTSGRFKFEKVDKNKYWLKISYIGYNLVHTNLKITSDKFIRIQLTPSDQKIDEIIVVASEKKGLTSTSVIGKTAMEHLQPSSFTDILALLPGGMTKLPHMHNANIIHLRETRINSSQYSTSAQGTKFIIDGSDIGTSANMQYIPHSWQGDEDTYRDHVNLGVDMRTIPTDDIEKVEIIRGIPSVRYGNVSSGVVNIIRKIKETPLETRFKADGYGKLFYIGKGLRLEHNSTLNIDGGLLLSRLDPRNHFENFNRINSSLRYKKVWNLNKGTISLNTGFDYTKTLDNVKKDPEMQVCLEDSYKSYYNKFRLTNSIKYQLADHIFLKSISLNISNSLSIDRIKQTEIVSTDRDHVVTNLKENGVSDGYILPPKYLAEYEVEGKPFYSDIRLQAEFNLRTGIFNHDISAGGQWHYNKNFGRGSIYDITRPLHGYAMRPPRPFKDIPATKTMSLYTEDNTSANIGESKLLVSLGVRASVMAGLDSRFKLHNKISYDPRLNIRWDMPKTGIFTTWIAAGIGRMSVNPTMLQLYQETLYYDITQLYYWNTDPAKKRCNYRTFVIDRNNYNLDLAHNNKFEIRLGFDAGKHHFSITYFNERMNDGFRYTTRVKSFPFIKYDRKAIDSETLDGPPSLEDLPFKNDTILSTYRSMGNGSRTIKEGIEFQYTSSRIPVICTRITFNGAWFHTVYENSHPEFCNQIQAVVGDTPVNSKYIGLYDWNNSYKKNRVTTNMIFDTYIDKLGLIISTTMEGFWTGRKFIPAMNVMPTHYIDINEKLHKYTEESQKDKMLQWLNLTGSHRTDLRGKERYYVLFNFKATKKFGNFSRLSFFADRILSIAPDYMAGDFIIRRSFTPYFGMELNIRI